MTTSKRRPADNDCMAVYDSATSIYKKHQVAGTTDENIVDAALAGYEKCIQQSPKFADAYACAAVLLRHKALFVIHRKRCHNLSDNPEAAELLDKSKRYLGRVINLDKGLEKFARGQLAEAEKVVMNCEKMASFSYDTMARITSVN